MSAMPSLLHGPSPPWTATRPPDAPRSSLRTRDAAYGGTRDGIRGQQPSGHVEFGPQERVYDSSSIAAATRAWLVRSRVDRRPANTTVCQPACHRPRHRRSHRPSRHQSMWFDWALTCVSQIHAARNRVPVAFSSCSQERHGPSQGSNAERDTCTIRQHCFQGRTRASSPGGMCEHNSHQHAALTTQGNRPGDFKPDQRAIHPRFLAGHRVASGVDRRKNRGGTPEDGGFLSRPGGAAVSVVGGHPGRRSRSCAPARSAPGWPVPGRWPEVRGESTLASIDVELTIDRFLAILLARQSVAFPGP